MPPIPTVIPDGQRIREFREQLGYTRKELAFKVRCHPKTISKAECRPNPVSRVFIGKVARALRTDPSHITLLDSPEQHETASPAQAGAA